MAHSYYFIWYGNNVRKKHGGLRKGGGGMVVVGVFQLTYLIDWYWTTSVYYARENKFIMIDHIHSGRIDFFYPIFFYVLLPNLYSFIRSRIDKGFKHHRFITFTAHIIFSLIISNTKWSYSFRGEIRWYDLLLLRRVHI